MSSTLGTLAFSPLTRKTSKTTTTTTASPPPSPSSSPPSPSSPSPSPSSSSISSSSPSFTRSRSRAAALARNAEVIDLDDWEPTPTKSTQVTQNTSLTRSTSNPTIRSSSRLNRRSRSCIGKGPKHRSAAAVSYAKKRKRLPEPTSEVQAEGQEKETREEDSERETRLAKTRKLNLNIRSTRSSRLYSIYNETKSQGTQYQPPSPDEADEDEEVKSEPDLELSIPQLSTQDEHDAADDSPTIDTPFPNLLHSASTIRSRLQLAVFKVRTNQSRRPLHLMSTIPPDPESDPPFETPENYRELMRQRMWLGYLPEVISGRAESPELGVEDSGLLSPPRSPEVLNTREGVEKEGGIDVEEWAEAEMQNAEAEKDGEVGGWMAVPEADKEVTEGEHDTEASPTPLKEISIPNQQPRDSISQKPPSSTTLPLLVEAEKPASPDSVGEFMESNVTKGRNSLDLGVHEIVTQDLYSNVGAAAAMARYDGNIAEEVLLHSTAHPRNITDITITSTPTASTQPHINENKSTGEISGLANDGGFYPGKQMAIDQKIDESILRHTGMVHLQKEKRMEGVEDEFTHREGDSVNVQMDNDQSSDNAVNGLEDVELTVAVDENHTDTGAVGMVHQKKEREIEAVDHEVTHEGDQENVEVDDEQRLKNSVWELKDDIHSNDHRVIHNRILLKVARDVAGAEKGVEGGELSGSVEDVGGQENTRPALAEEVAQMTGQLTKAIEVAQISEVAEVPETQAAMTVAQDVAQVEGQVTERGDTKDTAVSRVLENPEVPIVAEIEGNGVQTEEVDMNGEASTDGRALTAVERTVMGAMEPLDEVPSSGTLVMVTVHAVERVEESNVLGLPAPLEVAAVEQATPMTSMAETLEMQAVIEQSTRHVTSDTRSITTVLPGHNSTIPPPPIDGTPEIPIREPTVHEASPAEAAGAMGISVGHNDELSMSYTGLPEVGIAPTPVAPTLVKRGRGRPRKYPLPLDADGNPIQPPKPVKKARKSNVGSREAKRRRSSAISSALREVDQGSDPAPIAPMEEPVAGPSVAPTNADGGVEINKEVIAEEEVVGNKDGDVDMDKEMEEDVVPKEGEANEVREVAETLPELRSEVHCEAQPETEPETQPEAQPETQPETQPEVQPGAQSEAQPGAQSEAQSEAHSEAQSEAQPEARPEAQPKVQPEAHPAVVSEPPRLTIAERLAAMTPMEKLEALRSLRAQRTPQLSVAERLTRMTPMERVKAVQTMSFAEMKEAAAWLETLNNGNKAPGVEEGAPTSAAPVEPSEAAAVEASEEVVSTNTVMESEAPITEEEIPREEVPENGGNAGITPEPLLKVSVAEEEPTKDDLHEDNTNEAQVVSPPVASPLKRGRGRPRKYPRPDDINGLPVPRTPKTPKKISRKTSKKEENKGEEHEKEEEEKGKKTGEEKEENDDAEGSSGVDAGETEEAATAVATVAALDVQANTTTTEILTLPIKRGRGRPRKHPRPEDVNGLPLPVQKKKRRRYIGGAAAVNKDKDDGASEEAVSIENSEQSMPEGEVHSGEVRNEEGVVSSEAVRSEEEPVVERGEGEPAGGRLTQSEEDIIARINGTLRRCSLEVRLPSEGKEDESQNAEGGVGEPETHEGKEDESQNAEGGVGEPETHEGKEDESQNAEGGVGEPETHEGKEDESQNAEGGVGEPETHEGKRLVLDEVVIVKGGADETMEESGEVDAEAQAGLGVKAPLSPTMTSPVLLLDEVIHPPLAFTPIPTPLSTTIAMPILVSPSAQTIMLQSIPTSMPTPSAPTFMPPSTLPPRLPTCPPEPHQAPPPILDYTPPGVVYRTLSAPSHWDRPQPPPPPRGHVESLYSNLNIPPDKMKQLEAWRNLGRAQINPPPPMQGCFNVNVAGSASASAIANGSVPFGGQFHSHKMPVPAQWPAQAQPLPPVQRQREGAKREGEMDSVVVPFPKRQNVGTSTQSALGMAPLVGIPSQLLGQMVIQPLLQWQAPESSIVEAPQASSSQLSSAGQTYQELPSQPSQIPLPQKQKTPLQLSPPSPHQGNQTSPPQNSPIGFEVPASPVRSVTIPHANGGVNGHWMEIQLSPASEAPAPQAHVRKESYPVPSPPSQKKNAPYRPPLSTPPTPAAGFLDTKTISTTFHAEAAGLEDSPDGSMDKPKRTRKSSTGRVRRKGLKWVIYSGEQ